MNLFYEEVGEGNPVVLLHAFPLSRKMWRNQAEMLSGNGFRIILPDLPGFGENVPSKPYSLEEIAEQIAQLIDSLKIEEAIIGGLSMGGYVLFELFRLAREKVSALILCDTTYQADTIEKRDSRFELITKIENQGAVALVENMLPNLISDVTKQNNENLVSKLELIFSEVNPISAVNALRSMADRRDNSDIIREISVPTLLIFGEFDRVTNLNGAFEMNRLITGSELIVIKKAGHYSNLEQPADFNEALLEFCKNIKY